MYTYTRCFCKKFLQEHAHKSCFRPGVGAAAGFLITDFTAVIAFITFMAFIVFIGAFMDVFMRFIVLMAAMTSRTACMWREQGVAEWLGQCELYISTCLK